MTDLSLPKMCNPQMRNLVIFNSLQDEFASIEPEFRHRPFADQLEAIRFIGGFVADQHEIDVTCECIPGLVIVPTLSLLNCTGWLHQTSTS